MLAALFVQQPDFDGRRVVTMHNQRDFIFFRQHRYIFESDSKDKSLHSDIQEMGPQFTLKLLSLKRGLFGDEFSECEWERDTAKNSDRRQFFL